MKKRCLLVSTVIILAFFSHKASARVEIHSNSTEQTATLVDLLDKGLTHMWEFDSNYEDAVTPHSLIHQSGTSFVADRKGENHRAVQLIDGSMFVENGIRFNRNLTIAVWAYVLSHEARGQVIIDCVQNKELGPSAGFDGLTLVEDV